MSVVRDVVVDHTIDGDTLAGVSTLADTTTTFVSGITTWQRVTWKGRVRLQTVNAPDKGEPKYDEATRYVADRIKPGDTVRVVSPRDLLDQFGRMLGDILYNATPTEKTASWRSLSQDLLDAGLASPMTGKQLRVLAPSLPAEEADDFLASK